MILLDSKRTTSKVRGRKVAPLFLAVADSSLFLARVRSFWAGGFDSLRFEQFAPALYVADAFDNSFQMFQIFHRSQSGSHGFRRDP